MTLPNPPDEDFLAAFEARSGLAAFEFPCLVQAFDDWSRHRKRRLTLSELLGANLGNWDMMRLYADVSRLETVAEARYKQLGDLAMLTSCLRTAETAQQAGEYLAIYLAQAEL